MLRFFRNITNHYKLWFLFVAVLTLLGGWAIVTKIQSDNSIDIWFLEDDPHYQEYLAFQKKQGSDEIVMALIKAEPGVYDTGFVHRLAEAERKLAALPYVRKTLSLASAEAPRITGNRLLLQPLYRRGSSSEQLSRAVRAFPLSEGHLIDSSEQYTTLYLQFIPTIELKAYRQHIIQDVRKVLDPSFREYKLSGFPVYNELINTIVLEEAFKFSIAAVIVVLFVLLLFLPDLRYLLLAMGSVIVPVVVTFGLYAILGYKMNSMTIIVPTILMVYGLSDTIHILNTYHHTVADTVPARILKAFRASLRPCFYTTLTTMVGYMALYLAVMPALKLLGIFSALGLMFAFLSSYIVTGIGLMMLEKSKKAPTPPVKISFHLKADGILHLLNRMSTEHYRLIIGGFALLFIAGFWSVPRVEIDNDSRNLMADGAFKKELEFIEHKMGGGIMFFLNLISTDDSDITHPGKMRAIRRFEKGVRESHILSHPVSIVDVKDYITKRSATSLFMHRDFDKLMSTLQVTDKEAPVFNLMSPDKKRATMLANVRIMSSKSYIRLHHKMDSIYAQSGLSGQGVKMEVKGYSPLYIKMVDYIYTSQLRSFIGAFIVAFLILFYFVRNLRITILALIPNLFPILMLAIFMYLLGINLEAGNSIIAPILLGIAMDDTIHLLYHYQRYHKLGRDTVQAMDHAMHFTGRAIITTTLSLVLGFMVIGFSRVETLREFGILCSSAILFALLADALLLPALIKRYGP